MTCPNCGVPRDSLTLDCPACGIVFARFDPEKRASQKAAAVNPYAAPRSDLAASSSAAGDGRGVWRDGDVVVMHKEGSLPNQCIKCGQKPLKRLDRTLYWHHPGWYFLVIFPGLLIYAIIALVIRKKAKISIPICARHDRQRRIGMISGGVGLLVSILVLVSSLAFMGENEDMAVMGCLGGVFAIVIALAVIAYFANIAMPKKIDDTHVWIRKVHPSLLNGLPPIPK